MLRASELPQEERDLSSPSVISQAYGPPTAREDGTNTTIEWKVNETDLIRWTSQPIGRIEDGSTIKVEFFRSGRLHRDDGPALVTFTPTGTISSRSWFQDGRRARADGPSHEVYLPDGSLYMCEWAIREGTTGVGKTTFDLEGYVASRVVMDSDRRSLREEHFYGGVLNHEYGPAVVEFDPVQHSQVTRIEYWVDGRPAQGERDGSHLSSDGAFAYELGAEQRCLATVPVIELADPANVDDITGPVLSGGTTPDGDQWALVQSLTDPRDHVHWLMRSGGETEVTFYRAGQVHRDDGPAVASFDAGGRLRRAQWWSEGQMHRTNGPADQEWDWRGSLVRESWHRKDSRISGPTEIHYDRGRPTVFTYAGHRSDVTAKDERTRRLHQAAITGRATARTEVAAGARPRRPTAPALTPQSTHHL